MSLAAGERKKEMVQIECRWVECSARPAVTPATLKRAATNFAAW